jgi:glyoxylase-like metal-dependent hydrolase (beta-lactamase superfamily II)
VFRVESHGDVTRIRMAKGFLGRPLHEVSAYRIGDLLVDTGPPPTAGRLVEWCREARASSELSQVVLTHHHEDHSGGAAALQEELGLPVHAPAGAVPILAEGLRMPLYRRLVWGTPRRFRAEALGEEVEARLGRETLRFRVIPTPGHAFTHVCLFEPGRRWLVSGDLYVHPRVRYLRRIEDVWQHLDSLRRVMALEPELLLCAHAGLIADARGALAAKIAWWEGLADEARALRERGWPVRRITRRLLGREGFLAYASFGDFSKRNLVRSLLAGP